MTDIIIIQDCMEESTHRANRKFMKQAAQGKMKQTVELNLQSSLNV